MTLLTEEIARINQSEKVAVAFPDDGAHKRFSVWLGNILNVSLVICTKVRVGDKRVIQIKEGKHSILSKLKGILTITLIFV